MDASTPVSGTRYAICPMCEGSKLAFSGLYSARCPVCGGEPGSAFLEVLREIVNLPELPENSRNTQRRKER